MKPETIQKILVLLKEDMGQKRGTLLRMVEAVDCSTNVNFNSCVDERIKEYRAAYNAYNDFYNWMEEQEQE